jgi:hypothetical protein
MRLALAPIAQLPQPAAAPADETLLDPRFRRLLTAEQWATLPAAIRTRFSKRLAGGRSVVYTGCVTETVITPAGRVLAQLARLIGAPLPTRPDTDVPSVVTVTEDMATGGQIWTRLYARRDRFPQVIQSSKRFAGETGLEEHIGYGIAMSLTLEVADNALLFHCHRYFLRVGGWTLRLPRWLSPGALTVGHHDLGAGRFAFTLDLAHPWFGPLIHQRAEFVDGVG